VFWSLQFLPEEKNQQNILGYATAASILGGEGGLLGQVIKMAARDRNYEL